MEDVVWLVVVLFWILSGVVRWVGKNFGNKKPAQPTAPPPAPGPGRRPAPPAAVPPSARPGIGRPQAVPPQAVRPGIGRPQAVPPPQAVRPGIGRPAAPPAQRPPPPPPQQRQPQRASRPEDALADLLKRIGVDVNPHAPEPPVPGEHARTPSEHAHTPGWHQPTASEHAHTPGWHQPTASEARPTASEQTVVPSEHRPTLSEHRPGDARPLGVAAAPGPRPAAAPGFGRRMVEELRGGRETLARAIVLREILGPPVGLRSEGDRPFEQ